MLPWHPKSHLDPDGESCRAGSELPRRCPRPHRRGSRRGRVSLRGDPPPHAVIASAARREHHHGAGLRRPRCAKWIGDNPSCLSDLRLHPVLCSHLDDPGDENGGLPERHESGRDRGGSPRATCRLSVRGCSAMSWSLLYSGNSSGSKGRSSRRTPTRQGSRCSRWRHRRAPRKLCLSRSARHRAAVERPTDRVVEGWQRQRVDRSSMGPPETSGDDQVGELRGAARRRARRLSAGRSNDSVSLPGRAPPDAAQLRRRRGSMSGIPRRRRRAVSLPYSRSTSGPAGIGAIRAPYPLPCS